MRGIVKSFNKVKGYGFIISNEVDKDVFVHNSQILVGTTESLATRAFLGEGDKVEFELHKASKGLQAIKVSVIKEGQDAGSNEALQAEQQA